MNYELKTMNYELRNSGFSLTEVLIAVGILAVAMIMIAGVFPVGIHFSNVATDRTLAVVIADEAFAKIRLYGNPADANERMDITELRFDELRDFNDWYKDSLPSAYKEIEADEFAYPSDPNIDISKKQYCWSALCRRLAKFYSDDVNDPNRLVQVTVFVCKKTGTNLEYFNYKFDDESGLPVPVRIENISKVAGRDNELEIGNKDYKKFINDGSTIVDDETGEIYRVLERYPALKKDTTADRVILLDKKLDDNFNYEKMWVVPPAISPGLKANSKICSGKYPCIGVFQRIIRF